MGFYHLLVGGLMNPEDDFVARLRKYLAVVCFFPGSLLTGFYMIQSIVQGFSSEPNLLLSWISASFSALMMTFHVAQYFWLRKTRTVTPAHAGALCWVFMVLMVPSFLTFPQFDNKSIAITVACLTLLLQVPKRLIILLCCLLLCVFHDWNEAHLTDPDRLLVLPSVHPDFTQHIRGFIDGVVCTVIVGMFFITFYWHVKESERRGNAQKAANKLTLDILQCQKRYDTKAISLILEECKEAAVVDKDLVELYETMNSNLESYRPFLPNYLFQTEDGEKDGGPREDLLQMAGVFPANPLASDRRAADGTNLIDLVAESQQPSPMAVSDADSSVISYTDVEHLTDVESSSDADINREVGSVERRVRPMSGASPADQPQSTHFTAYISLAVVDIQVDRLLAALKIGGAGGARAAEPPLAGKKKPSLQIPEINFLPTHDGGKASTVKTLVNIIYSLANETKASVHSLVGDTVQLSWNATHTISLPETKGALFLARLRKLFATRCATEGIIDNSHPSVAGAVCSGEATLHSIFSTTQQRSLVIDAPWLPALHGCFDLAKRHGAMLMDERTARGATLTVAGVAVEKLFYRTQSFASEQQQKNEEGHSLARPYHFLFADANQGKENSALQGDSPPSASTTLVYQLLDEKTRQENLEWMYQLDGHERGGAGTFISSNSGEQKQTLVQMQQTLIESYADGRHDDVVKMLEASSKSYVLSSPISRSPPSESFGGGDGSTTVAKKTAGELCLPSLRAAMMASVTRSRGMISKSVPSAMGSATATRATVESHPKD